MSRSSPDKANYHHGNLRQALLDAGFALLATTPATQISLRELARAANVSHTAPYHYFKDKQELIHALGVESMRRFVLAQRMAAEAADDPVERLVAMGLAYVRFAAQEPNAFVLIFDPTYCKPGEPTDDIAPLIEENETLLRELTSAAQAAGALPPDKDGTAAAAMWAAVHGMANLITAGHLPMEVAEPALRSLVRQIPSPPPSLAPSPVPQ